MDILCRATKRNDAEKLIDGFWKGLFDQVKKFGCKVICDKTSELSVYKGCTMNETYRNVIRYFAELDIRGEMLIREDLGNEFNKTGDSEGQNSEDEKSPIAGKRKSELSEGPSKRFKSDDSSS